MVLVSLPCWVGHGCSLPPQFTFFPWLPGQSAAGCLLLSSCLSLLLCIPSSLLPYLFMLKASARWSFLVSQLSMPPVCQQPPNVNHQLRVFVHTSCTQPTPCLHLKVERAHGSTLIPHPPVFLVSCDDLTCVSICSERKPLSHP